jgi:hypothetical protein
MDSEIQIQSTLSKYRFQLVTYGINGIGNTPDKEMMKHNKQESDAIIKNLC